MDERHAYWLAALLDGEGSILMRDRRRPSGRLDYAVVFANNDRALLERAAMYADAGRIYESKRHAFQLRVEHRDDVVRLLTILEPLLVTKRQRACDALDGMMREGTFRRPRVRGRFSPCNS